jgi:tetratricopeptide (TPR) repeat protein
MKCPQCNVEATKIGAFWVCLQHGQLPEPKPFAPMRIFLSYGHDSNEELVRRIKADLEKRGHDVWIDKSEIKFGDDWRHSITDGILKSNRVLSFLSKHSTRDPGVCRDEIAIAIGVKGGNIQTILVESEQEVQPPVNIGHIQWLDMHDWKERRDAGGAGWEQWYQAKLAEIVRVVESDESRRFAGEIETLNGHLKPIKSDARICQLLSKGFYGRQWLFEAVEEWRQDTKLDSRLFWIMGAPGVGKSAFAAQLTHTRGDTVIAAQFCEWDKPDHRYAQRVVRSLAFQLATRLPDYRKLLLTLPEIAQLDRKGPAELFDYLLANPLRSVINGGRGRYLIVIDALDEAGEAGRNPLVEMLARNAQRLPDWFGIVVTSRPEFDVKTPLQALNPFPLDTKSESNHDDIRDYLRGELAPHLQNRPDADGLVEQILEKSEGVFLYVERLCDDVQRGHLSLDRPEQFPQGLGGIFDQYFKRLFPDLEKFRNDVRPALRAILAAREPLPVEILQRLFNWQEEELRDFIRLLASLFPVTAEAGHEVIKPYHKSLADWLTDKAKAGPYFVSVLEGHRMLGDYCLNMYKKTPWGFSGFVKQHLPYHLAQAEDGLALLSVLLDSRLNYFHVWAEQNMAVEGCVCLEFLIKWVRDSLCESRYVPPLATQLARLYNRLGQDDQADTWLRVALSGGQCGSDATLVQAVALHELGSLALSRHQLVDAHRAYRRALKIARTLAPPAAAEIAANLIGLAVVTYLRQLRPNRTIRLASLALRFAEVAQDPPHIAEACRILTDAYKDDAQYDQAEAFLERGLATARETGLAHATMSLLTARGWMTYQRAALGGISLDLAELAFRDALRQAESSQDWRYIADAWSGLGQCGILTKRMELVDEGIRQLAGHATVPLPPHLEARRLLLVASSLYRAARSRDAALAYARAATFSRLNALWSREVDAVIGQGAAAFHAGAHQEAEQHWHRAQALLVRCPRVRHLIADRVIRAMKTDSQMCPL